MTPHAYLVLEDGSIFPGISFGADLEAAGEVVFTTSMTGYQEVITDPSFAGQIVTMTCPHIGNVGVNPEDMESGAPALRGLLVRDYCDSPSNWRARGSLSGFLRQRGVPALTGVDTRALTRRLRSRGVMRGIISTMGAEPDSLVQPARSVPDMSAADWVAQVTTRQPHTLAPAGARHVVLLDCGAKANIAACLVARGCQVTVVPASTSLRDILALRPAGVCISNGPGDPAVVTYVIQTIRQLAALPAAQMPAVFGICLGHQLLALALGGSTYKLKFGHRGCNHPVKDLTSGKVNITSQNHGYAVQEDSLAGTGLVVTHTSLNDGSVEGLRHQSLPIFSVQYHPEASPGPHDSLYLFDRFVESLS
ncbi:MAG: glutamine-hydrolyzing carbamoyl-phosphate synthase small subunit [Chloroflexota bacterium]|nr:glutamine-hydrolyzing carbamoyl-phosphate synthase small subunit [Chloroflexota bacterium]